MSFIWPRLYMRVSGALFDSPCLIAGMYWLTLPPALPWHQLMTANQHLSRHWLRVPG